jgi:hypothetical protein
MVVHVVQRPWTLSLELVNKFIVNRDIKGKVGRLTINVDPEAHPLVIAAPADLTERDNGMQVVVVTRKIHRCYKALTQGPCPIFGGQRKH